MKRIKCFMILLIFGIMVAGCIRFSPLVGKWELEQTNNPPFGGVVREIEFFSDGTGRMPSILGLSAAFTWRRMEGGRLRIDTAGITQIYDIEISGSTLTFFYNRATNSFAVYRRVR